MVQLVKLLSNSSSHLGSILIGLIGFNSILNLGIVCVESACSWDFVGFVQGLCYCLCGACMFSLLHSGSHPGGGHPTFQKCSDWEII